MNGKRGQWIVLTLGLSCVASYGCGGEPADDAGVDGSMADGSVADDAGPACTSNAACDDGVFCNGTETCDVEDPGAGIDGCVSGEAPCTALEECREAEGLCVVLCPDADGDGHAELACGGDDCDDADANNFPGNTEVCDEAGHDEDCNADTLGFIDADGDGSGSAACCNGTNCGPDCDDTNASIGPGEADGPPLACDGLDNDCNGVADDGCPCVIGETQECGSAPQLTRTGICLPGSQICAGGAFTAECLGGRAPQEEVCDGLDNDCDGVEDDGVLRTYYEDRDADGFGTSAATLMACSPPSGWAPNDDDCDDDVGGVNPLALEICDGVDNDCDGTPDPGCACVDGTTLACGMSSTGLCQMGTQRCIAGAYGSCVGVVDPLPESCNGADDDCDGVTDDGVMNTYYPDSDGDGFGAMSGAVDACSPPAAFVRSNTDCDDTTGAIHPAAADTCDGVDNNCDGTTDPGCACTDGVTRACGAADGGGGILMTGRCTAGTQRCVDGAWADCVGAVSPSPESCNGLDDDCDGVTDNGVLQTYYRDVDADGFGAASMPTTACAQPAGFVPSGTDCNDGNGAINPAAFEACDGVDNNCDGSTDPGCGCTDGMTRQCGPANDMGLCTFGTQVCVGGAWSGCAGAVLSTTEVCNGFDDDCDGADDDAFACSFGEVATGCTTMCGVGGGTQVCQADCSGFGACSAAEACNGCDDDLNGAIDDTYACARGALLPCNTICGVASSRVCSGACEIPSGCYAAEVCNYCDDDGDGTFQEERFLALFSDLQEPGCLGFDRFSTVSTGCAVPVGLEEIQLVSGAANFDVGAIWTNTTRPMGWGDLDVHAQMRVRNGTSPAADGWALVIADGGSGDLGAASGGLAVPWTRTGLAIEWRFYRNNPNVDQVDTVTVRRLTGSGSGTVIMSATNIGRTSMDLGTADGSSDVIQHLHITYTPEDPNTADAEERLEIRNDATDAPFITLYSVFATVTLPNRVLNGEFQAGDPISMGLTAANGGRRHSAWAQLGRASFSPPSTTFTYDGVCD